MHTKLKAFLVLAQEQVARWDIGLEPAMSNLREVQPVCSVDTHESLPYLSCGPHVTQA